MKQLNIIYILLASLLISSCSDDFLNIKPQKEITADDLWKESSLAEAYMYDIYFTFQDAGFTEELQASACDESLFTHGREFRETNSGAVTDVNLGWFGKTQSGHQWERLYKNIRSCNDFIENIDDATFDEKYKIQLKGEAYFLRAYFYHRLTRAFGGIPMVLKLTQLGEDDYTIARSSYTDCIDQILSDIDNAAEYLKDRTFSNTQKGRATLAAVLALKARVLTDAASDLHDEATATSKSSLLSSYGNKELLFYTKGTRQDRWNAAKNAAKALMDNPMGHALSTYGGDGLSVEEKAEAIWKFFLSDNEESIFSRYFIDTKDESGTKMPVFNGPSGYHAWGGNTPIQEFVDDYLIADGSKFDWNNPEHKAHPYKNREPRFYANIMYDGMQWIQRPSDYAVTDPYGMIQTGYYQTDPAQTKRDQYFPGMDTRTGGGENWNATYTGYYLKKYINPADGDHRNKINAVFPFIRFTEVVMNYVEACIELNELAEAKKYLNILRNRVGLPSVDQVNDQSELRRIYQRERRVELCYEEQRYWDIRRWMIAPQQAGITGVHGIDVVATLKPGVGKQERYVYDESKWDYTYTVISLSGQEARTWLDKNYFLPIHRDEMNRNDKLIQNPGYTTKSE
ncbi:RagB/SusD family nutrient uptake outer membrane protein [Parabacteroides sp. Marseille-P3160]|uniref:RagB/SusD family nutrient uptake outer membrane protein n=1 Tax=Parabacteroides sp. Marseille-P3160 TaxID=1917887 RepID=UPI0009BC6EB4|nr:RagB/SusD family nutrient uptake outer membrane protein [Parabacteroides sp. Marseille-P3160]